MEKDENYVPFEVFNTTVRALSLRILELTISVLALRDALTKANQIPIPKAEFDRLYDLFRDSDEIRDLREGLQSEPSIDQFLIQALKDFEGPIQ
jgi:hypothetical protein